jgi:deoxyhypusine synthase
LEALNWRLSDEPVKPDDKIQDPEERKKVKCTFFLGYTSNMASCGVREVIRFLCQHKLVDCLVTTGGGIEEDLMKCMAPTYTGSFEFRGTDLRPKNVQRIGNLLISNTNYVYFEDFMQPLIEQMLEAQREGYKWTPSRMIAKMGERINNEESIYYWCWKNDIPVFCPGITDGAVGDSFFAYHFNHDEWVNLDLVPDVIAMNMKAVTAYKTA